MKYVYVLTSSEKDLYYEQFFISVVSLRLYNPVAYIVVLIDSKTIKGLNRTRSGYEKIVSETVVINAPQELSQREVSRWIKTSMKRYVTGDFLYIDCDTIIIDNLEYDFSAQIQIGAILDTHIPLANHHLAEHFKIEDRKLGFTSSFETGLRYNGGIIFCRDTPKGDDFFSRWHNLWLFSNERGNHHDMPSLNQANHEMGNIITAMDGEWNCQITHNGLIHFFNAKIVHYYATAFAFIECPFQPGSKAVLTSIKESGTISSEIMEMLKNPKTAFQHDSRLISGEAELDTVNSKFFSLLLRVRKKKPLLFKKLNNMLMQIISGRKS